MGSDLLEFSGGETILHYRLEKRLGRGGMGVVYQAYDQHLHRTVAIKFLRQELTHEAHLLRQFQQEAIAASNIDHPAICKIFSIQQVDSRCFIVMEFVQGDRLDEIIARGPQSQERVCDLLIKICEALQATHKRGIVHRDIKPGNIILTDQGQIKIMDFGMAKLASDYSGALLFQGGQQPVRTRQENQESDELFIQTVTQLRGTPAYMSPEQIKNESIDHRTDIFAIGVLCYEMLTGQRPFKGSSMLELLQAIVNSQPRPVRELDKGLDPQWEMITQTCLAKDKSKRYANINILTGDIRTVQTRVSKDFVSPARKKPFLIVASFLIALFLLTVSGVIYFSHKHSDSSYRESLNQPVSDDFDADRLLEHGIAAWVNLQNHKALEYFQLSSKNVHYASLLSGHLLLQDGRQGKGMNYLDKVSPDSIFPDYRRDIAHSLKQYWTGNRAKALFYAEKLAHRTKNREAGMCAAFVFDHCGLEERACDLYKELTAFEKTPLAFLKLSSIALENKDDSLAGAWCQQALYLAQESNFSEAICRVQHHLGKLAIRQSKLDSARTLFQTAITRFPQYIPAFEACARVLQFQKRPLEAEQILQYGLTRPFDLDQMGQLYVALGKVYLFGGRFVNALTSFDRAKELGLESGDISVAMDAMDFFIDIYIQYGMISQAYLEYEDLSSRIPALEELNLHNQINLEHLIPIKIALADNNCQMASQHFAELKMRDVQSNGRHDLYWQFLAQCDTAEGNPDWVPTDHPDSPLNFGGLYYKSRVYAQRHQISQAIALCQRILDRKNILDMDPRFYFKAQMLLSDLYLQTAQPQQAVSVIRSFLLNWQHADPRVEQKQTMVQRLEKIETQTLFNQD
jgi:serine/threonine protein kinase